MERIWACVADGVVVNTCVGDDDFAALIGPDFDAVVEITDLDSPPGIGWTFDGAIWRASLIDETPAEA